MNGVIVGALTTLGCLTTFCLAVGPFVGDGDENLSPSPYYDIDGSNTSFTEGDIKRDSGGLAGEAATVGDPWKDGRIPYEIDCSIRNLPQAINALNEAIEVWQTRTKCIRFEPKTEDDEYYVTFLRSVGCWASFVGFRRKNTQVSIGHGCEYKHVMVHELGHVIGFWHEQSRPDRDDYVFVRNSNIIPSLRYNFNKVTEKTDSHGEGYDFGSIMHYPLNAFAINRKRQTLVPRVDLGGKQPYVKLSDSDVVQARRMYSCDGADPLREKPEDDECKDSYKDCPLWAKHNHCDLAANPLLFVCRKSCDNCGKCVDESPSCPSRYNYLLCDARARFAFRDCKKTCEVCTPEPTKPPTTRPATTRPATTRPVPTAEPTSRPTVRPIMQSTSPSPEVPSTEALSTSRPTRGSSEIQPPEKKYIGFICEDRSPTCRKWMEVGRCETDSWVKLNCLVSCNRVDICDPQPLKPAGTCSRPLGLSRANKEVAVLPDSSFRASSLFRPGGGWEAKPSAGRLYAQDDHVAKVVGAWCASPTAANNAWFEVDLGAVKRITAVATQGRDVYFEHTRTYEIAYKVQSTDEWTKYSVDGDVKVLEGNCDHFTPVLNILENPIPAARYVRLYPKSFRGTACLRAELYGC